MGNFAVDVANDTVGSIESILLHEIDISLDPGNFFVSIKVKLSRNSSNWKVIASLD